MAGLPVVQVFARAPQPGECKTRLIPALGARRAAALQRWMIGRTLTVAQAAGPAALELWHTPQAAGAELEGLASAHRARLRPQGHGDLGRRMTGALGEAVASRGRALLVGTDCPLLGVSDLRAAAAALDRADAAMVPAEDGGFVLIGVRRPPLDVLEGITWGGPEVLAQTRARLQARAWQWIELPARPDLDCPGDLVQLGAAWFGAPAGV